MYVVFTLGNWHLWVCVGVGGLYAYIYRPLDVIKKRRPGHFTDKLYYEGDPTTDRTSRKRKSRVFRELRSEIARRPYAIVISTRERGGGRYRKSYTMKKT